MLPILTATLLMITHNSHLITGCYILSVKIMTAIKYSKEEFLAIIIYASNFSSCLLKGFVILHVFRKVVYWIFSSFCFPISFLKLKLCALKCWVYSFDRGGDLLWNTTTYKLYLIQRYFSHWIKILLMSIIAHSYLVCVRTAKDPRWNIKMWYHFCYRNGLYRQKYCYRSGSNKESLVNDS